MKTENRKPVVLLIASILFLAVLSIGCGGGGASEYHHASSLSARWVTGYVYDSWTDHPVYGAEVIVEDDYWGDMSIGYTDYDGYFEVYVGDYYDYEDIGFRVLSIDHPDYYTYFADSSWYLIGYGSFLYTGDYLLDWR
ncbi:MAG: hypothetical protein WC712_06575 [Candidatus Brocadiia bacterium]